MSGVRVQWTVIHGNCEITAMGESAEVVVHVVDAVGDPVPDASIEYCDGVLRARASGVFATIGPEPCTYRARVRVGAEMSWSPLVVVSSKDAPSELDVPRSPR